MEAIRLLKKYKKRLEPFLKRYFSAKINQAGKIDSLAAEAVRIIEHFTLADGKRLRPALVYYGYLAAGGRDCSEIVEASMGMELVHSFLLIHDDIIDRDKKRHGVATVHERYKEIGKKIAPRKDYNHFGNSMAMIVGDIAASMANEIIFNAKFPPKVIVRALDKVQNIVYITIPGEMVDIVMEMKGSATEDEILRMHEGKTARYTFEGPLHLGAVFAGARDKTLQEFSHYALPLGKAFQIRDDILGVFGDEKRLGKPVGSDVIEGKQTLLVIKALEMGDQKQKKIIRQCLGKKNLNQSDLNAFRAVIRETGSLDYSIWLSEKLVKQAESALEKVNIKNNQAATFLKGIAEYIIKREN